MSSATPRLVRRVFAWLDARGVDRSVRELPRDRAAAIVLSTLAGVTIFAVATTLFPYHSANHDEGVYLLQASMLLEGRLELHAGAVAEAVRPWFFVEDGSRLYSKYSPVPAAMYAISMALFGEPRVTLGIVAAGNTGLVYWLGAMTFDRRVGLVAASLFVLSPMTLLTSSVFLPYAPTTLLNLVFAVAYLRGLRTRSVASAAVAGVAVGLAFFARPYTAVLFAAPFVAHACWTIWHAVRQSGVWPLAVPVRRHGITAAFGLAFVGLTLAYNARVTGSALTFPYAAFAPLDGPGFGYREILGHSMVYTPELAVEANGHVLWYLAARWFVGGLLGTGCALAGLVVALSRARQGSLTSYRRTAGLLLAALVVTIPAGNVFFWGNRNVLATMSDPTDGLLALFGPFYHFDLLAPLSIFAAVALVAGWRRLREVGHRLDRPRSSWLARALSVAFVLVLVVSGGAVTASLLSGPVERNQAYTERYESAYEPIDEADFENALVFVPTPYGEWLGHPFQSLRNDPGLDGPVVYALERGPAEDFAVADAYPNRTYYRYAYRGEWTADPTGPVAPKLERLRVRGGSELAAETVVGVPDSVTRATVRLDGDRGQRSYDVSDPGDQLTVPWTLTAETATLTNAAETATDGTVELTDAEELLVTVTLVTDQGATLTYRQRTTVRTTADRVEVIWPAERTVCPLVDDCGTEGTYLPATPDAHLDGVSFETRIDRGRS
jgi:4-amino-4-deoxy-L-arabinose transferase-like glycosyltransferase